MQISYLFECLVCEVKYENKSKNFVVILYRSASQTYDEFDKFLRSFESVINNINQSNSYFVLVIGNFNARSAVGGKTALTIFQNSSIEKLTSCYGLIN